MNASKRTRYASTPTYGMQKQTTAKKSAPLPSSSPDFTQMPIPELPHMPAPMAQNGMPSYAANPFSPPVSAMPGPSFFPSQAPSLPPFAPMPGANHAMSHNVPPFIQPGPMQSVPTQGMMQPFSPMGGAPMGGLPISGPPMGNMLTAGVPMVAGVPMTPQPTNSFLPRQQGFVPPVSPMPLVAMPTAQQNQGPPFGQFPSSPKAAPFPPMGQAPRPQGFVPGGFSPMAPTFGTAPMAPGPVQMGGPPQNMMPSMMPSMPGGAFAPPPQPREAQPMDWNKVLKAYLFGILPALFIPCIFVAPSMDFLRYAFLVLCVIGLAAMWVRRLFVSSTCATISIVYAALCIVVVSLLLSGARDAQQANANANQPGAGQATYEPGSAQSGGSGGAPSPEAAPTPAPPVALGESDAEQRLMIFMDFWSVKRIEDMVSLVQPSWATTKENPSKELFNVLLNRTPQDYTIEGISGSDADNSRTVTMSASIDKNNNKEPVRYRFMILMVKESNQWYVDPNSLATNDTLTPTPSPVDGQTAGPTTIGLATPAPTTTVTPVPPPNTKLYFNPDGGKQYHADPNCPKVKEQYLPLAGNFMYSELGNAPYKSLQPCLACGAPIEPLE